MKKFVDIEKLLANNKFFPGRPTQWQIDILNEMAEPEENIITDEALKKFATKFFYHWWNQKGTNTEQGYSEWITTEEGIECIKNIEAAYKANPLHRVVEVKSEEDIKNERGLIEEIIYLLSCHDTYGTSDSKLIKDIINLIDSYKLKHSLPVSDESIVTRVEVIDDKGRSYTNWSDKNKVELSYQDNGRTLKIFITQ